MVCAWKKLLLEVLLCFYLFICLLEASVHHMINRDTILFRGNKLLHSNSKVKRPFKTMHRCSNYFIKIHPQYHYKSRRYPLHWLHSTCNQLSVYRIQDTQRTCALRVENTRARTRARAHAHTHTHTHTHPHTHTHTHTQRQQQKSVFAMYYVRIKPE